MKLLYSSATRGGRVRLAVGYSAAAKGFRFLTQLVIVGLTLRHLGAEGYGLWLTAVAALGWLSWGQLGVAPGLVNSISEAEGGGRSDEGAVFFTTALALVGAIAIVMLIVGQLSILLGGKWLGTAVMSAKSATEIPTREWRIYLEIALLLAVLRLPLGLIESAFVGLQKIHVLRAFDIAGQALAVGFAAALYFANADSAAYLLGIGVAAEFGVVGAGAFLILRLKPNFRPRLLNVSFPKSRRMFSLSAGYLIVQVTGYVVTQGSTLLLAGNFGVGAVPAYALTWQIYQMAAGVWMMGVTAMWGPLGEANATGDSAWIRKARFYLVSLVMGAALLFSLLLGVFGNYGLALWSGGRIQADPSFLWAMSANCLVFTWTIVHAQILSALSVVWRQVLASIANATLFVIFAFWLIPLYGALGLAIALASACALTTAWIYPVMLMRYFRTFNSNGGSDVAAQ